MAFGPSVVGSSGGAGFFLVRHRRVRPQISSEHGTHEQQGGRAGTFMYRPYHRTTFVRLTHCCCKDVPAGGTQDGVGDGSKDHVVVTYVVPYWHLLRILRSPLATTWRVVRTHVPLSAARVSMRADPFVGFVKCHQVFIALPPTDVCQTTSRFGPELESAVNRSYTRRGRRQQWRWITCSFSPIQTGTS